MRRKSRAKRSRANKPGLASPVQPGAGIGSVVGDECGAQGRDHRLSLRRSHAHRSQAHGTTQIQRGQAHRAAGAEDEHGVARLGFGHPVAEMPTRDTRADRVNAADQVMAQGKGQAQLQHGIEVVPDQHVREHKAGSLDPDAHLAWVRLWQCRVLHQLDDLGAPEGPDFESPEHHGRRPHTGRRQARHRKSSPRAMNQSCIPVVDTTIDTGGVMPKSSSAGKATRTPTASPLMPAQTGN